MSADCNIGIYEEQDEIMKGNSSSCTQYGSPDKRRHCLYPTENIEFQNSEIFCVQTLWILRAQDLKHRFMKRNLFISHDVGNFIWF